MNWTIEDKVRFLLRLPWDLQVAEEIDNGERYYVARITEIPSAIATGADAAELEQEFWESLEESLRCYLTNGDTIPLPVGVVLPWEAPETGLRVSLGVFVPSVPLGVNPMPAFATGTALFSSVAG